MANASFVQEGIPHFDGDYDYWSMLMENFLGSKELWEVVKLGIQKPGEDLKDLKAKNYLFQAIERPILETIFKTIPCKDTSKVIWDSLKEKYQGSSIMKRARLQALRRDFEILQMKEGETVTSYFGRTMEISNKMKCNGETIADVTIVQKILRSLTRDFNYVVFSIEDMDKLPDLDKLQSSLMVHEQIMNGSSTAEEQALKASVNPKPGVDPSSRTSTSANTNTSGNITNTISL